MYKMFINDVEPAAGTGKLAVFEILSDLLLTGFYGFHRLALNSLNRFENRHSKSEIINRYVAQSSQNSKRMKILKFAFSIFTLLLFNYIHQVFYVCVLKGKSHTFFMDWYHFIAPSAPSICVIPPPISPFRLR